VVAAGVLAYSNSLSGPFILDDNLNILHNQRIRHLWPLHRFLDDTRPVVDFTLALNYAVGRLEVRGYHAVNLAIHLLSALTLFGLIRRTLMTPGLSAACAGRSAALALAVAVLWVVHPLTTQAVSYVIQRAESLMALFYVLTLYCTIREAASARPWRWRVAAVAACALGMGSKGIMVTAPLAVLLYDRSFLSPTWVGVIRRRWSLYAGLFATYFVLLRLGVLSGLLDVPQQDPITVGFGLKDVTPWRYALTQAGVILHYLRLCVWPWPLCADYGWPLATSLAACLPAVLAVGALLGLTVWAAWKAPPFGYPAALFFIVLAPSSSVIPIKDLAFEHRMYLPLAAVVTLVVASAFRAGAVAVRSGLPLPLARGGGVILVVLVAVALGLLTHRRNDAYAQPVRLWQANVDLAPHHPRPHNALGFALHAAGDPAGAIRAYQRAIELDPNYAGAYANIGDVYWSQGNFLEAVRQYQKALQISPFEFTADFHYRVGSSLLETGRPAEAIVALRDSLAIDPEYALSHYNLGNAQRAVGRKAESVNSYREAVRIRPGWTEALVNMGLSLSDLGRLPEALEAYRTAVASITPSTVPDAAFKANYGLAGLLLRQGAKAEARPFLVEAVRIKPAHAGAQSLLRALEAG
jgi:tetratricopeptide (TPR) repeat protein